MTTLFKKCSNINLAVNQAAEVGVYKPEISNILDYIERGVKATLVEPDPSSINAIETRFANRKNVVLHKVAVYDYCGEVELSQRAASTFISSLPVSPAIVNDKYSVKDEDKFTVKCVTFDAIDDGKIDLLSIDIEGAEWFVLKYLKSNPKVISIETHGKFYQNPYLAEIKQWMKHKSYTLWFKDQSDSVYIRNDVYQPNAADKIKLKIRELRLGLRRLKRFLK
jgi:FkbM family methyltransferase